MTRLRCFANLTQVADNATMYTLYPYISEGLSLSFCEERAKGFLIAVETQRQCCQSARQSRLCVCDMTLSFTKDSASLSNLE